MRTKPISRVDRHVNRRKAALLFAGIAFVIASGLLGYRVSEHLGVLALNAKVGNELDLLAAAIDNSVTRLAPIPSVVELDPRIVGLLRSAPSFDPGRQEAANRYLEKLNARIDGLAVFVLDLRGTVIASSDWIYSDNLVGKNLTYRRFFQAAVAGTPYREFAIDPARNEPGYFFAHPIRDKDQDYKVIGVAVMKVGLARLERQWLSREAAMLIVDSDGIVVLSSIPDWKYTTLKPHPPDMLEDASRRQFNGIAIGDFPLRIDIEAASDGKVVHAPHLSALPGNRLPGGNDYLAVSRHLLGTAWQIVTLTSLRPVYAQAATHAMLAMIGAGGLLTLALVLAQRRRLTRQKLEAQALLERANSELEQKVALRTKALTEANRRLRKEVAEREQAEATLRAAHDELVQAGKLAVLGQLATGITHELTQPLGAIRTLAGNAIEFLRRGKTETTEKNLAIINRLTDQMGGIITPLKTFARKSPAVPARVDVAHAVSNALFLLEQRLARSGVRVDNTCEDERVLAWCDQNRLEQVLINLIGNAADAMREVPERTLTIAAGQAGSGQVELSISDTGPGLPDAVRERLFEPFFTTKPAGEGLGLGLAISRDIVRDFGGELVAENTAAGGACFRLRLPAYSESMNT